MKIALVIERLDPTRGGRETSISQVAAALADAGNDVTILCEKGRHDHQGVTVRELGCHGGPKFVRLLRFVADVQAAARGGKFDIVHATLPVPGCTVYQPRGGTVASQRQTSIRRRRGLAKLGAAVAWPMSAKRLTAARLERQVVQSGAWCLGVSEMVSREFATFYGRGDRVRTVFNAVDVPEVSDAQREQWRRDIRSELGIGEDETLLMTAAQNLSLKGADWLVRAFARRENRRGRPPLRLLVLGVGDSDDLMCRLVGGQGLGDRVHLRPPTDSIFRYYSAADGLVLLSWYDACSRVVLEAVRWQLPCITTEFNGAAEILRDGTGIVVPRPDCIERVIRAMDVLTVNEARETFRAKAREVAGQLSTQRHVERLLEVYEEVIADQ